MYKYILASLIYFMVQCAFATSVTVPLPNCHVTNNSQLSVANNGTAVTAVCDNVTPPPSGAIACTQNQTGDVPGFTATCAGVYKWHTTSGTDTTKGPFAYSYVNVFHAPWPGAGAGTTDIFTLGNNKFLAIPFVPSPGHSIGVSTNDTWQKHPLTMSVSLSPGHFASSDVVCVTSRSSSGFVISSNGLAAQCKLDPNKQYWLNFIPATNGSGSWVNPWGASPPVIALDFRIFN